MKKITLNKKISLFSMAIVMLLFVTMMSISVYALTDTTRPTIISVSPVNNQQGVSSETDVSVIKQIFVTFSEAMDPSTINTRTFTLIQRTTPESGSFNALAIDGTVTYSGGVATFTPDKQFTPNEQYGNVFTATITTGAKDLAGHSISQNYIWSFTTGNDPFNTGATTSQQNQPIVSVNTPVIPSSTTPPAQPPLINPATTASTTAQTTSTFPWIWVIGALLLLLFIVIIFVMSMRSGSQRDVKSTSVLTTRRNPFGDVHPVMDIEGIGPEYNKKLQAIGIKNTKQLWEANAVKVAYRTGAPLSLVKSWQHMAELASVKDIGPQYAELIERSGIHSIDELKNSNPTRLLNLVNKKQDSLKINIQGNSPGHAMVEHWIAEAHDHKFHESRGETA